MNRGVYLSIPEPNLQDYVETSRTIEESFALSTVEVYYNFFE